LLPCQVQQEAEVVQIPAGQLCPSRTLSGLTF
jgi:hypothetical protein